MKRSMAFVLVTILACMMPLLAQGSGNGNGNGNGKGNGNGAVLIPDTSVEYPGDAGHNSHTNHVILFRDKPNATVPSGMTPTQIANAYALPLLLTGGAGSTIAIVDAYDYPSAYNDLTQFSKQFSLNGLPLCASSGPSATACFWQVYATATGGYQTTKAPRSNCGWAQEAALDIEWAHAMAPYANIVLVEAASNGNTDLFNAVSAASKIVTSFGTKKGEVSMSWGGSESSNETSYDTYLKTNNVVYFASSGDTGGQTIYPGTSPYVVSAGGTSLTMNGNTFVETGWSGSGGGVSQYEPIPSYQSSYLGSSLVTKLNGKRGAPDFSFDADPYTGVSVYDTTSCYGMSGWMVFGGTSVASPSLAGIVNSAGSFSATTAAELGMIYMHMANGNDFRDIISGAAGKFSAGPGWDFVTGVGSNQGLLGK